MSFPQAALKKRVEVSTQVGAKVKIEIPADEYRSQPVPGFDGTAKLGECFVRVTDIPNTFEKFMEVNPRVPNTRKSGVLSGPVVKGILSTLRDNPEQMALKNQGIYILAESVNFLKSTGGRGILEITLSDQERHGIVNGGHTYAAIIEAVENAEEDEVKALQRAFVRFHIFQGIEADLVPEIAEGLNRSKQVDDPSLANLRGLFDTIEKVMRGKVGEKEISYYQGDEGEIYIAEVLVYIAFFNCDRYNDKRHPYQLYRKQAQALKYFSDEINETSPPTATAGIIEKLPEILYLSDMIRKQTPEAAKQNGFEFGRMKAGRDRVGSEKYKGTHLPFIDETVDHRVPNGWVYPMLAAFRANINWDSEKKKITWKEPLKTILPNVISDLVGVCVTEHRDNNMRPELIGKRESAYRQCYDKVQLYLAKKGLLK